MNEFIKDKAGLRAVRKSDVSAVMINKSYYDYDNNKKVGINFILKSGEKATICFDSVDEALNIVAEL